MKITRQIPLLWQRKALFLHTMSTFFVQGLLLDHIHSSRLCCQTDQVCGVFLSPCSRSLWSYHGSSSSVTNSSILPVRSISLSGLTAGRKLKDVRIYQSDTNNTWGCNIWLFQAFMPHTYKCGKQTFLSGETGKAALKHTLSTYFNGSC